MPKLLLCLFLTAALVGPRLFGKEFELNAPNKDAKPVNQLIISGNACGPAALLSSFRLADPKWQELAQAIPGKNDRSRLSYLIRNYGMRPSNYLGRPRWNEQAGINLLDLTDIANELKNNKRLPELEWQVLLQKQNESGEKLIKRCHTQFVRSLKKGLPPVIGLQRLTNRPVAGTPAWVTVHGHFVVITGLPRKLDKETTWMPFQYADPWGAQTKMGIVKFDQQNGFPALVAEMPYSKFGTHKLKKGEESIVILASGIGVF